VPGLRFVGLRALRALALLATFVVWPCYAADPVAVPVLVAALPDTVTVPDTLAAEPAPSPDAAREPAAPVPVPRIPFEPEFADEFRLYKHERDGLSAMKAGLAFVDIALAAGIVASSNDPYTLGIAGVTALRGPDFVYEVTLLVGRHLYVDAEIKNRADIRKMRAKWQRVSLLSAALNFTVGALASIGWLTTNDRLWHLYGAKHPNCA
jgi:hypothetical protein